MFCILTSIDVGQVLDTYIDPCIATAYTIDPVEMFPVSLVIVYLILRFQFPCSSMVT